MLNLLKEEQESMNGSKLPNDDEDDDNNDKRKNDT